MTMRLVYVAGAVSAKTREGVEANIDHAEDWGVEIAKLGGVPWIPHANTQDPRFERVQLREFWYEATLEQLRRCDAVFLIPGWENSDGGRGEKAEAERLGMPVFETLTQLAEWLGGGEAREQAT